jgi:hypothetical protein
VYIGTQAHDEFPLNFYSFMEPHAYDEFPVGFFFWNDMHSDSNFSAHMGAYYYDLDVDTYCSNEGVWRSLLFYNYRMKWESMVGNLSCMWVTTQR